jgi:hypothetical protein
VLLSRRQWRGLATDHPEDCEKGDYANGDSEKIKVFSIHKPARYVAPQGELP